MNEIIVIIVCLIAIILLKIGLDIKFKEIKKLNINTNQELKNISEKFPQDEQICKDILKKFNNRNVKILINQEYNSCLYTIYNNTITIGKFKQSYMKLQTISHECIHACQDKLTLWFNFIISNIYNLYFLVIMVLTLFNKIQNTNIYLYILTMLGLVQYIIRNSLENEAMTKAPYLAKEYIEENNIITTEEKEKLLKEYNRVNKIGIPFMNYLLIQKNLIKIMIFCVFSLI